MKPSEALATHRAELRQLVSRHGLLRPRVFGSVRHGTDTDGSDLDLLVDAPPGTTLFRLGGLQVELETLLGVKVDLLTPGDLSQKFRAQVLAEAQPV
jgi:predicted nucleotidyltransferase